MRKAAVALLLALAACSHDGTGTGNPLNNATNGGQGGPGDPAGGGSPDITTLFSAVCSLVQQCHPEIPPGTACVLDAVTGFGPKLGIQNSAQATVNDIVNFARSGTIN